MFKEVLQSMDLTLLRNAALLIFLAVFIAVVIWAVSRPKEQVREWAKLPLSGGEDRNREENRP